MENKTLKNFTQSIVKCAHKSPWDPSLKMYSDNKLSVYYSPFEHINTRAKIVICGITPGKTQSSEAIAIAQHGLNTGLDFTTIQKRAKQAASFKGFRKPLSSMLDLVGLNKKLNIDSCHDLFSDCSYLVHYTSAVRYPVVLSNGNNYNGTPRVSKHPFLVSMLDTYLAEEVHTLGEDCLWLPLGKAATEALEYLVSTGVLNSKQLLSGLPHPSGANAERIAYFLGNKPKEKLSVKVNPDTLDSAKSSLVRRIKAA
ncbi:hypothetical protein [Psychromonas arctica]|uniref:hypothetical protein n=1 Tax=Psychromonas arctica TaxID=168275 RepID=UPI002FCED218